MNYTPVGHLLILQVLVSSVIPSQSASFLTQVRRRVFEPTPHVLSHIVHIVHSENSVDSMKIYDIKVRDVIILVPSHVQEQIESRDAASVADHLNGVEYAFIKTLNITPLIGTLLNLSNKIFQRFHRPSPPFMSLSAKRGKIKHPFILNPERVSTHCQSQA